MKIRSRSTLTSPSSLEGPSLETLEGYLSELGNPGVAVNVLLGEAPWDCRPLILERGTVWMYRPVPNPSGTADRHLTQQLPRFAEFEGCRFSLLESNRGTLFIRREYVADLLPEIVESSSPGLRASSLDLAIAACDLVSRIEGAGLVHGHIVASNLALGAPGREGPTLLLLDPLVGSLTESLTEPEFQDSSFAPEVSIGRLSHGSDCYGLAGVVEELLDLQLTAEQRSMLREMRQKSSRLRPSAADLRSELIKAGAGDALHRGGAGRPMVVGSRSSTLLNTPPLNAPRQNTPGQNTLRQNTQRESAVEGTSPPPDLGSKPLLPQSVRLALIICGSLILISFLLHYKAPKISYSLERLLPFSLFGDREELERLLDSGERSRVREVARRAVLEYSRLAEDLIVERTLLGDSVAGVDTKLLRSALNPQWSHELSFSDRRATFLLSVLSLVPEGVEQLPTFKDLHPGVILAILANVNVDNPSVQLKNIQTSSLATLPEPIGAAFARLDDSGVKSLSDRSAIALALIISGNHDAHAIEAFFGDTSDMRTVLQHLQIVLPFFNESKGLAEDVYSFLGGSEGLIGQALGWFEVEKSSAWNAVPAAAKLETLFGRFPKSQLSFEQLADLLLFPLAQVRNDSKARLAERFLSKSTFPVLDYLASDNNRLSRTQNILLLATLYAKPGTEAPFVGKWFELNPPPLAVLSILLARDKVAANDVFNFEAARYLKRAKWEAPVEAIKLLAAHSEPLARTLAYARLKTEVPEERAVLEARSKIESEPALKAELERRLSRVPF